MAIKLQDKTRVTAPDSDFPYGDIKDSTPGTPGTPVNKFIYGDFHQFFAKISAIAGIVLNGLYDSAYSGFQYFQALLGLGFKYYTDPIILGLLGSYTQGDVIILNGVVITLSNSNNTATWTKGDIYYCPDTTKPGKVYKVAAGTTTKSSGVFLYSITDEEDCLIQITHGTSGTGIANYLAGTVKLLEDVMSGAWVSISSGSLLNGWIFSSNGYLQYKKDVFNNVHVRGYVQAPASSTNTIMANIPVGNRPHGSSSSLVSFDAEMFISREIGSGTYIGGQLNVNGDLSVNAITGGGGITANETCAFQFCFSAKQ